MQKIKLGCTTLLIGILSNLSLADSIALNSNSCLCELAGQTKCQDHNGTEHDLNDFVSMCAGEPAVVTRKHYFSGETKSVLLEFEPMKSFYERHLMSMIRTDLFLMPQSAERDKEISNSVSSTLDFHLQKCLPATNDPAFCNQLTTSLSKMLVNLFK